jgi:hypothetical protein
MSLEALSVSSDLRTALRVCNCWALYRNVKLFGDRRVKMKAMFDFCWSEYQLEFLGLAEYRKSRSSLEDLKLTLMHMQVEAQGRLALEFRCLAKAMNGLERQVSRLEWDPDFYKFTLTKHADEWHISTGLQASTFKVPKMSSKFSILNCISNEMRDRGIDVLYGVFKDQVDDSLAELFNTIRGCDIDRDVLRRFYEGTRARRIPNRKYQAYTGMDRKTYYKLVNFLEAISPGHWIVDGVDLNRIKNKPDTARIMNRILEECDGNLREIWEKGIKSTLNYSSRVESRRMHARQSMVMAEDDPCSKFNHDLRSLRKHKNRVPILIKDFNLYNLLKLLKVRPCPMKPYVNIVKFKPPYQIERGIKLMASIREAKFKVNYELKREAIEREQEVKDMHAHVERLIKRAEFSRIKAKKKADKLADSERRAEIRRQLDLAELEKRRKKAEEEKEFEERWERQQAEFRRGEIERAERQREELRLARIRDAQRPPVAPRRLRLTLWEGLDTVSNEVSVAAPEPPRVNPKIEARKREEALVLEKMLEIGSRWPTAQNRDTFHEDAKAELACFSSREVHSYKSKLLRNLRRRMRDTPHDQVISDFETRYE